jgi:heme/copper-type cytochrome/quinol oxidase subunit 3
MHGFRKESIISLLITVILAVIFTSLQAFEYINANFNISDGIYGATFYLGTGFHGLHVMIGTIFLFVCLLRVIKHHFASDHHFGFEAAA